MSRFKIFVGLFSMLLVTLSPAAAYGAFPGEPGVIAFMRLAVGGNWDIFTVHAGGAGLRQLTSNAGNNQFPSWSADGSKLWFTSTRDGNSEIYWMNPDGTHQTRVTYNAYFDESPMPSPDGTKVVFVSTRDAPIACPTSSRNALCTNYTNLYLMDADGSNVQRLPSGDGFDLFPMFSPDGSKIAWVAQRDGNIDLYVIDVDGLNQTRLTTNASAQSQPSRSPDGTRLAYRESPAATPDSVGDIWVMNADGSGAEQLNDDPIISLRPAWSPSGAKIVFVSLRSGNGDLYVMKADGTHETQITDGPARDGYPDWQPLVAEAD